MLMHASRGKRALFILAGALIAFVAWRIEMRSGAPSLGLFTFLSPILIPCVWLATSTRAEVRADLGAIARVFVLLCLIGFGQPLVFRARPTFAPTLAAASLHLAVLAPLLVGTRLLTAALRRRAGARRSRRFAAPLFGEALPVLLWLPVFMLGHEVHRTQATVPLEDIGIDWPATRIEFAGAGETKLVGLWLGHATPRGAVLLVHGIGADKVQFLLCAEELYRSGYDVFTYDQRNHGESGGLTTTIGLVEADDLVRAWAILRQRTLGLSIPRVALGVSMGGAAAQLALPQLDGLDGLILDSTFADIRHVAARRLPLGPLAAPAVSMASAFAVLLSGRPVLDVAPIALAGHAPASLPILILHGRADPLIPFSEAESLAKAYGPRATLIPLDGPGHAQGILQDTAHYREAIRAFAANLSASRGG
ncbi:Hypothetical protein A7982_05349 [Minicystis rosea]|nr:Hypothetical protein A7982_05349 [Minicystis rosea]